MQWGKIKTEKKCSLATAKELYKPVIRKFTKRRIVMKGIDNLWAADLVIMSGFVEDNDRYKYLLNVIDTFSKFAWSEPLKTKSGLEVTQAFENIVKRAKKVGHKPPALLHVDKGREFINKDFKAMLMRYGTKMYHTENEEKSAIIERFNRTVSEKLKVQFEMLGSFRWIDVIQKLMHEYNYDDLHRTIGMTPSEVNSNNEANVLQLYKEYEKKVPYKKAKLKIGDKVRITVKKESYANKYRHNWTTEIFTISKVLSTIPVTYRITDSSGEEIQGSFYEKELQKTCEIGSGMEIKVYHAENSSNLLLPTPLRCLIVGCSGSGKTNLLLNFIYNENGVHFKNLYVFSRSIEQPAYVELRKRYENVERKINEKISHFYSNCDELVSLDECKRDSLVVFDDCLLDQQTKIKDYFVRCRHKNISCVYLSQSYGKIDMQVIRNNVNLLCAFSQNKHYTKRIHDDFVGSDMTYEDFVEICKRCWNEPHGFITIDTTKKLSAGKYKFMLKENAI